MIRKINNGDRNKMALKSKDINKKIIRLLVEKCFELTVLINELIILTNN